MFTAVITTSSCRLRSTPIHFNCPEGKKLPTKEFAFKHAFLKPSKHFFPHSSEELFLLVFRRFTVWRMKVYEMERSHARLNCWFECLVFSHHFYLSLSCRQLNLVLVHEPWMETQLVNSSHKLCLAFKLKKKLFGTK